MEIGFKIFTPPVSPHDTIASYILLYRSANDIIASNSSAELIPASTSIEITESASSQINKLHNDVCAATNIQSPDIVSPSMLAPGESYQISYHGINNNIQQQSNNSRKRHNLDEIDINNDYANEQIGSEIQEDSPTPQTNQNKNTKANKYFTFAPFTAPSNVREFLETEMPHLKQPFNSQINKGCPHGVQYQGADNICSVATEPFSLFSQVCENKRINVSISTPENRDISLLILVLDFAEPPYKERTYVDSFFGSSLYIHCPVAIFDAKTLSAVCLYIPKLHTDGSLQAMNDVASSLHTNHNGNYIFLTLAT